MSYKPYNGELDFTYVLTRNSTFYAEDEHGVASRRVAFENMMVLPLEPWDANKSLIRFRATDGKVYLAQPCNLSSNSIPRGGWERTMKQMGKTLHP